MYSWRITKYNPKYRDNNDLYQKEEWISCSEIGKSFGGSIFTLDEYLATENSYINCIQLFVHHMGIVRLQITELEEYDDVLESESCKELVAIYKTIPKTGVVENKQIDALCRLVLRERIWCKLSTDDLFIHFGYDYYMYIGCIRECRDVIDKIKKTSLFVEEVQSPYI
jgi:hypothetical protein